MWLAIDTSLKRALNDTSLADLLAANRDSVETAALGRDAG